MKYMIVLIRQRGFGGFMEDCFIPVEQNIETLEIALAKRDAMFGDTSDYILIPYH